MLSTSISLYFKIFLFYYRSWIRRCHLSTAVADRFLELTKHMYSIQNESRFVNYTVDYLLDACASTPDFKSKVFDNPLEKCVFKVKFLRYNEYLLQKIYIIILVES